MKQYFVSQMIFQLMLINLYYMLPIVTNMNAVDNDLDINDGIVGVLSSANSQTPFLLPQSNSSSSQTYKIPNNKEAHHDVHEDLQHKAAVVDNLAIKGTYKRKKWFDLRKLFLF